MRGHVGEIGVYGEMGEAATEGEQRLFRIAVVPVRRDSVFDGLTFQGFSSSAVRTGRPLTKRAMSRLLSFLRLYLNCRTTVRRLAA